MRSFGFGTRRCTGFIHPGGLLMSVIYYLTADQIMVCVAASSKKQAIEQLAERTAKLASLRQPSLFEIVIRCERFGNNGIGGGIEPQMPCITI